MVPCEAARATAPAMMSLAGLVSTYRIKAVRTLEAVTTAEVKENVAAWEAFNVFLCKTADVAIMARQTFQAIRLTVSGATPGLDIVLKDHVGAPHPHGNGKKACSIPLAWAGVVRS